jgi:O-antigen ligase
LSHKLRQALVPIYLFLCLVLGGASAEGFWINLLLQLIGLIILVWSLAVERRTALPTSSRQLLLLLGLMLALVGLQLLPLPPAVWTGLGGRETVAAGFRLLDQPLPWLPISLSPRETLGSALWLLPAIAILLAVIRPGAYRSSWAAWAIAIVTIVSVAIGALQRGGGQLSPWYFYEITNYGAAVGFFSNANHQATLLVSTVPFLAALYLAAADKGRSAQRSSGLLVVLAGALLVLVVGIAINGSLAGVGLSVPVVAATLLMLWARKRRVPAWFVLPVALIAAAAVYVPFTAPLGNDLTTADAKTNPISRAASFRLTSQAIQDYLPLGSGIGTYGEIYPMYEDPATIGRWYMNHVHGDYLEVVLETGIPGLILIVLTLLWWGWRVQAIWRAEKPDHFARAATIASAAILAHSAVDYPLRTAAISALFALCLALMAEPRPATRRSEEAAPENRARHLSAD